jgi:hypothetical protein
LQAEKDKGIKQKCACGQTCGRVCIFWETSDQGLVILIFMCYTNAHKVNKIYEVINGIQRQGKSGAGAAFHNTKATRGGTRVYGHIG